MIHTLSRALRFYFDQYLLKARGASPNTMAAYRQTFGLFCAFLKRRKGAASARQIRLTQVTPALILDFLDHLEDRKTGRGNSIATRNVRLAALKGFFASLPLLNPRYVTLARQMQALPFKRTVTRSPDWLEREELRQVFAAIDRETPAGMRELTLLLFMYNVGARASEAASARISWLACDGRFPHVRVVGKGGRERLCPLWPVTTAFLKHYLASIRKEPLSEDRDRLFVSARSRAFTRWGVWAIVRRSVARAVKSCPALARKHLTAHSIRHSLGVHLLQAGVDMSVIRSWLGHIRLETTQRYARVRIQDAQAAVERFFRLGDVCPAGSADARVRPADESLLRWLESL